MKKFLSVTLTLCLLLTLAAALAAPAAAAEKTEDTTWHVIPDAWYIYGDIEPDEPILAGFEYTSDGFHTIPTPGWKTTTPELSVQSIDKVDLKKGVYLEVRIDDFTYLKDKWFNLHIWDQVGIKPGSNESEYGSGVQTLIRPGDSPDASDPGKPGKIDSISWYFEQFTEGGKSDFVAEQNRTTEDGKPILCLTLTWNGTTYALDINGAKAPQAVIDYMNGKWGGDESQAYIGFNAQNAVVGGTAEITITKFGTSKETAKTPVEEPGNSGKPSGGVPIAPIADPLSTNPAYMPGVFLSADRENSDAKNKPAPLSSSSITVNDDLSYHIVAGTPFIKFGPLMVKHDVSYDIKDFPVAMVMTRNFCTCGEVEKCKVQEEAYFRLLYGDVFDTVFTKRSEQLAGCYKPYSGVNMGGGEDTYTYYFVDFSNEEVPPTGRINGIQLEIEGIDLESEGANEFDVLFIAFFRTVENAEYYANLYANDYLNDPPYSTPVASDTTETDETEGPTETEKDEAVESDTAGVGEQTTEGADTAAKKQSGCTSALGIGSAAAVAATVACMIPYFRKKKE